MVVGVSQSPGSGTRYAGSKDSQSKFVQTPARLRVRLCRGERLDSAPQSRYDSSRCESFSTSLLSGCAGTDHVLRWHPSSTPFGKDRGEMCENNHSAKRLTETVTSGMGETGFPQT